MVGIEELRRRATFFSSREELRRWFEKNHATAHELWIAYYKKGAKGQAVPYEQAVEAALCFGWVDGQVRSLDDRSYANRYTPRRPGSRWSRSNVRRVLELRREGRMHPAGWAAFDQRGSSDRAGYSSDERPKEFEPGLRRAFQAQESAWQFFEQQPPSYRRIVTFWVMSAKREETRRRRLGIVLAASARRRRIDLLFPGRDGSGGSRPGPVPP